MQGNKRSDRGKPDNKKEEDETLLANNNRKKAIETLGEKYLDWYNENIANFKKFWLNEFVYPIVFPFLTLGLLRYVFHFNFTREQGFVFFSVLYLITISGRNLGKYSKLVDILDKRFDEIYATNRKKKA
jgi:hypothetical protein